MRALSRTHLSQAAAIWRLHSFQPPRTLTNAQCGGAGRRKSLQEQSRGLTPATALLSLPSCLSEGRLPAPPLPPPPTTPLATGVACFCTF